MLELHEQARLPRSNDPTGVEPSNGRAANDPIDAPVFRERLRRSVKLEAQLRRRLIRFVVLAIPLLVAIWVGLIALAVSVSSSGTGLAGPLAMGAAIGVLSGLFFGLWAAVVSMTETFETIDPDTGGSHSEGLAQDQPGAPEPSTSVDERSESVQ